MVTHPSIEQVHRCSTMISSSVLGYDYDYYKHLLSFIVPSKLLKEPSEIVYRTVTDRKKKILEFTLKIYMKTTAKTAHEKFWFAGWILWCIYPYGLFNAKTFLYIYLYSIILMYYIFQAQLIGLTLKRRKVKIQKIS